MQLLEKLFKLKEHGTNVRTEIVAGVTTFLTMAYIIFVNPSILAAAGMPPDAVFVATCLIAALGTAIMGLYANYPIALAPGMGLNAYFAFVVVGAMGYTWQTALGAVFISGCLFLAITLFGLRELIVRGIPQSLRTAIVVGIGMFLAIIALKSAGIVVASPATLVTLGDLHKPPVAMAAIGFIMIVVLDKYRVPGAILIGIVTVTVMSFFFGGNKFAGIFSAPPSIAPTFLQLDVRGALKGGILNVVLVFFLVELFDATGTLMGVAKRAGLLVPGKMERFNKALLADSAAIFAGSLLGTSSTTAYAESAAGVQAGGRTGLTAVEGGGAFFGTPLFLPGVCHGPGVVLCRLPDAARVDRAELGRFDRSRAGRRDRADDAFHLQHRQRPGVRLHHLCRAEALHRQGQRGALDDLDHRRSIPGQVHLHGRGMSVWGVLPEPTGSEMHETGQRQA